MLVRRFRTFSGQMFVAFVVGYGVLRFYVETLRADSQRGEIGPLSTSQFIGIVTALMALGLFAWLWRAAKKDPAAWRFWELPAHYGAQGGPTAATAAGASATATQAANGRKKARR
jgi:prolipoprotein diacylglyceryltransferase